MKSISSIVILITLLFSCASLLSQNSGERGLLIGFNASSFSGTESTISNSSYIPGLAIGFFQEFRITPGILIGPEIVFTTKGSRIETVGDLYLHQVITYAEVPLLVSWVINPGDSTRLFLSGGPTFGVMLLAFNEVGFSQEISRFDMGAELAIGVRWEMMRFRVQLNQGLMDVDNSSSITTVKNRTLSLYFGLSF